MEYVLSTENLCKQYSKHLVVNNVSLHIKRGEIYGFIGRNGLRYKLKNLSSISLR